MTEDFRDLNREIPLVGGYPSYVLNSPLSMLFRQGRVVQKTLTINGTPGAGNKENLYLVASSVQFMALFGHFTLVTDVSSITAAYFDLWDGTASLDVTSSGAPAVLTGVALDSLIGKNAAVAAVMFLHNSSAAQITDSDLGTDWLAPFIVTAKQGASTYIRFCYDSDGGGAVFTIEFSLIWKTLAEFEGAVAAV